MIEQELVSLLRKNSCMLSQYVCKYILNEDSCKLYRANISSTGPNSEEDI